MGDEDIDRVSSKLGDPTAFIVTSRSHGNRSRLSISSIRSTNTSLLGNTLVPGAGSRLPPLPGKSPRPSNALSTNNSRSPRISIMSEDDFFVPQYSDKTMVSNIYLNNRVFKFVVILMALKLKFHPRPWISINRSTKFEELFLETIAMPKKVIFYQFTLYYNAFS